MGPSVPGDRNAERGNVVDILLATYNGERFLEQQLDSLLQLRSQVPYRILAADDGSADASPEILQWYASRSPQVVVVTDTQVNRGPVGRFSWLAEQSSAPYVMFCDQDDLWMPQKLEQALAALQVAEALEPDRPVLVHTDLRVVDERLGTIADSFIGLRGLDPTPPLRRLLVENSVTGCTLMVNRPLLDLALPIPPDIYMHDWWLALLAASCGKVVYLPNSAILYRQHGGNLVGVRRIGLSERARRLVKLWGDSSAQRMYDWSYAQAQALLRRAAPRMKPEARRVAEAFVASRHAPLLSKRWRLLRGGFLQKHPLRRVMLLLRIR